MNLRPATEDDLDALAALHALAFQPGWDAEAIADLGSGPGVFGLMVEAPGPIGMILCRAIAGESEILTLAVDPAARRRGVGAALVRAAADMARSLGAQEMFLEVATDNAAALALYEAAGFARAGLRRGYYDRGADAAADAVVMRRDLNSAPFSTYP
ncbi:MAG TPA: GNAT family N-acetyltransferase [Phenylobacterium sp.]|nr:GNAT family N-acetyltransferase [Phenylobacterium sp.]